MSGEKSGLAKSEFLLAAAVILFSFILIIIHTSYEVFQIWSTITTPVVIVYAITRGGVKGVLAYMAGKVQETRFSNGCDIDDNTTTG